MIHFYSRKFYESHIKEVVEERMASLNRRAGLAGEAVPERIDVIAKVTVECWDGETEEFRQDCELAMECEYQQALKGWEASLSDTPTRTAEEIAALVVTYLVCIQVADTIRRTFTNAAFYLQPTRSSSVSGCVRRCCSLGQSENEMARSVCRGESTAAMQLRHNSHNLDSVNAGKTRGLSAVDWPTFDWQGFSAVEACMINFARECFSTCFYLFISTDHEYLR
jgi:hypothetical protein